jgi:hypothetical protein
MSDSDLVSTAAFGPGTLGPIPRPTGQKLWDPAHQAMDPGQRRELQDERVRHLIRRVLETPVPLFAAKLKEAGITSPDDVKGVDDLSRVPSTVKQDLRDSEAEAPPGHVDGYHRPADHHRVDPQGHLDRVRIGSP